MNGGVVGEPERTLHFTLRIATVIGEGESATDTIRHVTDWLNREDYDATLDDDWHVETDEGGDEHG